MKYLTDYTEQATTDALTKAGAFFAFSDQQFDEQKQEDVKYVSAGAGLICPVDKIEILRKDLKEAGDNGRKLDIKENGKEKVIRRELYNYECFYSHDLSDAISTLSAYGITTDEIAEEFRNELPFADC